MESGLNRVLTIYIPWSLFTVLVIIDIYLAFLSWDNIRESIGWVRHIPQKTDFKLRHILQYSPQAILMMLCLRKFISHYGARIAVTIFTITMIGAITEVIQLFRPQRIFSFMDIFWNFCAAIVGVVLFKGISVIASMWKNNSVKD